MMPTADDRLSIILGFLDDSDVTADWDFLDARWLELMRDTMCTVKRLPKTVDGKRVLPGDVVYLRRYGAIYAHRVMWDARGWFASPTTIAGPICHVFECYSTRGAAEAAGGS